MELGEFSQYSNGLQAGQLGFNSQQGQEIFLYSAVSRLALRPTQRVKRRVREADHSPPSSDEAKNRDATPLFPLSSLRGA
jgi:hypothetical protein